MVEFENSLSQCGFNFGQLERQNNQWYIEFGKYTPAGQDWWETLWFNELKDIPTALNEFVGNYDVDDEAAIFVEIRGQNGTPTSIRTIIEDAEWKLEQLKELYSTTIKNLQS